MAGPMTANRGQVQTMLKDIERAYMMKRRELRQQAYEAERALAQQFAEEGRRRASQYGMSVDGRAVASQGGAPIGWTKGFAVEFRLPR